MSTAILPAHRRQFAEAALQPGQIDQTIGIDRDHLDTVGGEAATARNSRVLDRRDQQPVEDERLAEQRPVGRQYGRRRLAAAGTKGHAFGFGRHQRRHLPAGGLDGAARRPALGMDRGGIADLAEQVHETIARSCPQGRSGVPVPIDAWLGHAPRLLSVSQLPRRTQGS